MTTGGVSLFDFSRGEYTPLKDLLYTGVLARDEWLTANPDVARGLIKALGMALDAMQSRPTESKAALREFFPKTDASVLDRAWDDIMPAFGTSLAIDPDGIQKNYDLLRDARGNIISAPIGETFTNSIVEAAQ